MHARTSRTTFGSLSPASPSNVRASSRRSREPRSNAKTVAPSVPRRGPPLGGGLEGRQIEQDRGGESNDQSGPYGRDDPRAMAGRRAR
jgi:hypothetical protein